MDNNDLVVVGVDGSEGSLHALRWAIAEGRRTGSTVQALTVWTWDGIEGPVQAATSPLGEREHAERISVRAVQAMKVEFGADTPLTRKVVEGRPVAVLVEASRHARLLVLGNRRHGRLHNAVLGSTSEECVRTAACAVVVVPEPQQVPVGVA